MYQGALTIILRYLFWNFLFCNIFIFELEATNWTPMGLQIGLRIALYSDLFSVDSCVLLSSSQYISSNCNLNRFRLVNIPIQLPVFSNSVYDRDIILDIWHLQSEDWKIKRRTSHQRSSPVATFQVAWICMGVEMSKRWMRNVKRSPLKLLLFSSHIPLDASNYFLLTEDVHRSEKSKQALTNLEICSRLDGK